MKRLTEDVATHGTAATYTEAQLQERLTSGGAAIGLRFDVLDRQLNVVKNVQPPDVFSASVQVDTSREVIGSLGLSCLPDTQINTPFRYRLKPWFRIRMRDGGIAEWPMGVYVWGIPTRHNIGMPDETWDLTLGDQTQILQLASPGPDGFAAPKGAHISGLIQHIVGDILGFDTSGIVHTAVVLNEHVHWGLTSISAQQAQADYAHELRIFHQEQKTYHRELDDYHRAEQARKARQKWDAAVYKNEMAAYHAEVAAWKHAHPAHHGGHHGRHGGHVQHERMPAFPHPHLVHEKPLGHPPRAPKPPKRPPRFGGKIGTTWLQILRLLHQRAGYAAPWFDNTGRYRAMPQIQYESAPPSVYWNDQQDGIMIAPVDITDGMKHLCNRVICRSHQINGLYDFQMADLNTLIPGHPLSQEQIGFYIDVMVHDQFADTNDQLLQTATAELRRRLAAYQEMTLHSLAWPVGEVNDVVAVRYSTDVELADYTNFLETGWQIDLMTGEMQHTLARITPPVLSEDS